jgi:hypothetical protein
MSDFLQSRIKKATQARTDDAYWNERSQFQSPEHRDAFEKWFDKEYGGALDVGYYRTGRRNDKLRMPTSEEYYTAKNQFDYDRKGLYPDLKYDPFRRDKLENEAWKTYLKTRGYQNFDEKEFNRTYNRLKYKDQYDMSIAEDAQAYETGDKPYRYQMSEKAANEYKQLLSDIDNGTLGQSWREKYKTLAAYDAYALNAAKEAAAAKAKEDKRRQDALDNGETYTEPFTSPLTGTKKAKSSPLDLDTLKQLGWDKNTGFSSIDRAIIDRQQAINDRAAAAKAPAQALAQAPTLQPRKKQVYEFGLPGATVDQGPKFGQQGMPNFRQLESATNNALDRPVSFREAEGYANADIAQTPTDKAYGDVVKQRQKDAEWLGYVDQQPDWLKPLLGNDVAKFLYQELRPVSEVINANNPATAPVTYIVGTLSALMKNGMKALQDIGDQKKPEWQGKLTATGWKDLPDPIQMAVQGWNRNLEQGVAPFTGDPAAERKLYDDVQAWLKQPGVGQTLTSIVGEAVYDPSSYAFGAMRLKGALSPSAATAGRKLASAGAELEAAAARRLQQADRRLGSLGGIKGEGLPESMVRRPTPAPAPEPRRLPSQTLADDTWRVAPNRTTGEMLATSADGNFAIRSNGGKFKLYEVADDAGKTTVRPRGEFDTLPEAKAAATGSTSPRVARAATIDSGPTIGKNASMTPRELVRPATEPRNIAAVADAPKSEPFAELTERYIPAKQKAKAAEVASGGGDMKTAAAKISYDVARPKPNGSTWDKLRSQLVDRFANLERAEKTVFGKVQDASASPYKQARLYAGVPERANAIIQKELNPIIRKVEKAGKSYKDLGLYATAVHAKDVNRAGLISGFTDAEIDDVIRKLGSPEMEAARKELVAYSNRRLDTLLESGRISKESVAAMREAWPNYMPLSRVMDETEAGFIKGLSDSFSGVSNPIKELKGSQRTVIDPIESMMKNTYLLENAAGRAEVAKRIGMLADADGELRFFKKVTDEQAKGKQFVIKAYENGKEIKYETTKELFEEISTMNKEQSNTLIKILSKPAEVLRAGATLTTEFAIRNPIRDVINAWTVTDVGFNPIVDFPAGLAQTIKRGDLWDDFLRAKGGYGNVMSMDRKLYREAIDAAIRQPIGKKFVSILNPKSWIGLMRKISDTTETATKLGVFRAARRKGLGLAESAFQARDTMDFARAGSAVQPANRIVAFLNSNIQGKSKLIRAIKEHPVKVTAKIATGIALPSVGAFFWNEQMANEEQAKTIKDSPAWLRDSFWLVAIPGTDQVARIPKPFDLAVFGNVTERFLEYAVEKDPTALDNFAQELFDSQAFPVMPTGLLPIIEGMANYSFFRQTSIIPGREKDIPMAEQYDVNTSETAKVLAAGARAITGEQGPFKNFGSPRVMDSTIRNATGGLGGYALDAIDWLVRDVTGIVPKNAQPAKNTSQLPVAKAFLVNENQTGKAMDFVYTERTRLTTARNSSIGEFKEEGKYQYIETVADAIGKISKQIREIQNDPTLTAEQKRDQINELSKQRNDYARKAQTKYAAGVKTDIEGYPVVFDMVLKGTHEKTKEQKEVILTPEQFDKYQAAFQADVAGRISRLKQSWSSSPARTAESKQKAIDAAIAKVRKVLKDKILWGR